MSNLSQFHQARQNKDAHKWHAMTSDDVLAKLASSKNGLNEEEVKKRREKYGPNKLPENRRKPRWRIFIAQFKSSLVYVLLTATTISIFLGDFIDAGVIFIAIFINVIIGFYEENKAQTAFIALHKAVINYCKVRRNGLERQIETDALVPGDIVFLSAGDKIPADLRIIKSNNLKTNETLLTGESAEIGKNSGATVGELIIADQTDMAFMGTQVIAGNGLGVVVAIGQETALGRIVRLVDITEEMVTPLQRKLAIFARKISILIIVLCALILFIGFLLGHNFTQMFMVSVAVAVSAIPEGLLVTVTMVLAVGMQRLLRKKALVKHLLAAEILGSVSVICSDKTGTMTEGEMRVIEAATHDYEFNFLKSDFNQARKQVDEISLLFKICMLCNNAYIENSIGGFIETIVRGSPTERALCLAGFSIGLDKSFLEKEEERLDEIPFDSVWKFMMTLNKDGGGFNNVYLKGAPEVVLKFCKYIYSSRTGDKKTELTQDHIYRMQKIYKDMSIRGLRVLACAMKRVSSNIKKFKNGDQENFIFIGLVGIRDPVRRGIKKMIFSIRKAGVKTVMITGDHKWTAAVVARDLGLPHGNKNILEGEKLAEMSESELVEVVDDITVYARVTPEDKLKIIKAWQYKGKVVAMTGDGINDSPALKKANIGIAVGSGTDVAKETADLILLDNNFKTIVAAIREGRVIFDNIKKIILYLLSNSLAEVSAISASLILGWPLPLLASQIIWINLVNDTVPALAMTQEPADENIMNRCPRRLNEPIFDKKARWFTALISSSQAIGILFLFNYFLRRFADINLARTMAFTFLAVSALFYIFSIRNLSSPIWRNKLFDNKFMIGGVAIGLLLQIAAIYHPFLRKIFGTVPIGLAEWAVIISACLLLVCIIEFVKAYYCRNEH